MRTLRTKEDLDGFFRLSAERPVWLFKHSLFCGISAAALREFELFAERRPATAAALHVVEIQNSRELSAEVAERTGVRHESPQVLLVVRGEAVWHASHSSITADSMLAAEAGAADVDGGAARA